MTSSGPTLLVIETGITLVACALAIVWPRFGAASFAAIERALFRLAKRRATSILTVGAAAVLLRLAILPLSPVPHPYIHDEFANLLAADTFSSGHLTNPTHPLWIYFESFHITQVPTYMSMYFPAQGLVLAAGKVVTGNPWFGVVLSAALMCSAICWMLQGWVPPGWALLGAMLAVIRLALFSYWTDSYYGGAVAAIGGALLLGALPRIKRHARLRDGFYMALGAAILANSRPFEGMLICVPAACALFCWARKCTLFTRAVLVRRALLPLAFLFAVAAIDGYYNRRVFGSAFTLPYQINRATYASAPVFIWQSPRPAPLYRYEVMRAFYSDWEMGDYREARTWSGLLYREAQKLGTAVFFFPGVAMLPALLTFGAVLRDKRVRFLVLASGVTAFGLSLNVWFFPHYMAPFTSAIYCLLIQSTRHLRAWKPGGEPRGMALARFIPLVCLLLVPLRIFGGPLQISLPRFPTTWYGTAPFGTERANKMAWLERQPGEQLAIVRYGPGHLPFDEWVYNAADIDRAPIVWARDTKDNAPLLKYFSRRNVWLVEPDFNPPRISPYPR